MTRFLKAIFFITEQKSGRYYVILSLSTMLFEKLQVKFEVKVNDEDLSLLEVAGKMKTKLDNYTSCIDNSLSDLARILYPRFWNDYISNSNLLCNLVPPLVKLFNSLSEKWTHFM